MQKSDKPVLRIRAIRESKGYTQEYMAEMLGLCQSSYAHLESGKTRLSVDRLLQIAHLLETDLDGLIELPSQHKVERSHASRSEMPVPDGLDTGTRKMYEAIIEEMRGEIQFLRSLIRPEGR